MTEWEYENNNELMLTADRGRNNQKVALLSSCSEGSSDAMNSAP